MDFFFFFCISFSSSESTPTVTWCCASSSLTTGWCCDTAELITIVHDDLKLVSVSHCRRHRHGRSWTLVVGDVLPRSTLTSAAAIITVWCWLHALHRVALVTVLPWSSPPSSAWTSRTRAHRKKSNRFLDSAICEFVPWTPLLQCLK